MLVLSFVGRHLSTNLPVFRGKRIMASSLELFL
jgi:hypothetical protein